MDSGNTLINNSNTSVLPQNLPRKSSTKKLAFLALYFGVIPFFLLFLVLFSLALKYESNGYISRQAHKPQFQALPSDNDVSSVKVDSQDGRVQALESFLQSIIHRFRGMGNTLLSKPMSIRSITD